MFKSILFRCSPLRCIQKEYILKLNEINKNAVHKEHWRQISVSGTFFKKRRPAEEKAMEIPGRRPIRYSQKSGGEVVGIWRNMTVQDIAGVLNKDVDHVFKALEFADKNSDVRYKEHTVIRNQQIVRDIVKITGFRFKMVPSPYEMEEEEENKDEFPSPPALPSALKPRAPVVCVMGHVDHGKTTLLDALRDSAVVDQEFGGITQHIGAFEVKLPSGETVTFLDTPGHAAFGAMRARGAAGADVVALVVAADDGVMDQTVEAIRMAREADVPILVVVNKVDKPGVNIEETLRSLSRYGVVCESLGGDVQSVCVSALKRTGLRELADALVLQAMMMKLAADDSGRAEGVVLEAQMDPATGKQATVLVQRGSLARGAELVAGGAWGKVRSLRSADGASVERAPPSTPVVVSGWRLLPAAGDVVLEVNSEKRAGEVMRWRQQQRMRDKQDKDHDAISARAASHRAAHATQLARKRAMGRLKLRPDGPRQKMIQEDTHPTLNILIKGDVDGSVEALLQLLATYDEHSRVRLQLAHFGVGNVAHADVEIAEAFDALIFAFNVSCPAAVAEEATTKGVHIHHHNVIYKLVDHIKAELSSRIPPEDSEEVIGEANVLQEFLVTEGKKKVPVAGARCIKGELQRDLHYRLVRGGEVIHEGPLASMKHLKEEVGSIKKDGECGLRLADSSVRLQPGDTLECVKKVKLPQVTGWDPGF